MWTVSQKYRLQDKKYITPSQKSVLAPSSIILFLTLAIISVKTLGNNHSLRILIAPNVPESVLCQKQQKYTSLLGPMRYSLVMDFRITTIESPSEWKGCKIFRLQKYYFQYII